jgi:hypothetical protein
MSYKTELAANNTDLEAVLAAVNSLPEAISIDTTLSVAGKAADAKAVGDALAGVGGAEVKTATIGTSWTEDSETGVKTQTVSISGITAEDTAKCSNYFAGEKTSDGYAAHVEQENQFLDFITNGFAETVDGGIKFTIFGETNTVEIPILVEVV